MQILLSNSQAGPGRTVKQEQDEISRNHMQANVPGSVCSDEEAFFSMVSLRFQPGVISETPLHVDVLYHRDGKPVSG